MCAATCPQAVVLRWGGGPVCQCAAKEWLLGREGVFESAEQDMGGRQGGNGAKEALNGREPLHTQGDAGEK